MGEWHVLDTGVSHHGNEEQETEKSDKNEVTVSANGEKEEGIGKGNEEMNNLENPKDSERHNRNAEEDMQDEKDREDVGGDDKTIEEFGNEEIRALANEEVRVETTKTNEVESGEEEEDEEIGRKPEKDIQNEKDSEDVGRDDEIIVEFGNEEIHALAHEEMRVETIKTNEVEGGETEEHGEIGRKAEKDIQDGKGEDVGRDDGIIEEFGNEKICAVANEEIRVETAKTNEVEGGEEEKDEETGRKAEKDIQNGKDGENVGRDDDIIEEFGNEAIRALVNEEMRIETTKTDAVDGGEAEEDEVTGRKTKKNLQDGKDGIEVDVNGKDEIIGTHGEAIGGKNKSVTDSQELGIVEQHRCGNANNATDNGKNGETNKDAKTMKKNEGNKLKRNKRTRKVGQTLKTAKLFVGDDGAPVPKVRETETLQNV